MELNEYNPLEVDEYSVANKTVSEHDFSWLFPSCFKN